MTAEDWVSLKAGNYSHFSEKERSALMYADKLTRSPGNVDGDDFIPLKQFFSDSEIVDLHLLVGVANLTNRFTGPLGLEVEFPEEKISEN